MAYHTANDLAQPAVCTCRSCSLALHGLPTALARLGTPPLHDRPLGPVWPAMSATSLYIEDFNGLPRQQLACVLTTSMACQMPSGLSGLPHGLAQPARRQRGCLLPISEAISEAKKSACKLLSRQQAQTCLHPQQFLARQQPRPITSHRPNGGR